MLSRERKMARIFKAFSDENRIAILQKLQNGEMCAYWLLEDLNISQSTLSHHMRVLADAEVIDCRRDGKWIYYSISETGSQYAQQLLHDLLQQHVGVVRPRCCDK